MTGFFSDMFVEPFEDVRRVYVRMKGELHAHATVDR